MIARTTVRVLLSLVLVIWAVAKIGPVVATDRSVGIAIGALLIAVGGTTLTLRLFARRWLDAGNARAQSILGYAAPPWMHDASGPLLMLGGLCLIAWWV
jgi:hypothetical protein